MQATSIVRDGSGLEQPPSPDVRRKPSWPRWLLVLVFLLAFGGACALRPVSPLPLFAAAGAGLLALAVRQLYRWRARRTWKVLLVVSMPVLALAALGARTYFRYRTAPEMEVPVREYSHVEYPEDPGECSIHCGKYHGRVLRLVRKDRAHFDFVLEPTQPHVARVVFRDVDVSLMTPSLPEWTKADDGLRRIALTDRQWNRQQVRFDRDSPHLEISGGDGFEAAHLYTAELAKNCLNAGLWEVLLFFKESGEKALYYQCWFTFPLGHYLELFEQNTGLPYWRHWYYLEHWFDPAGTVMPLDKLRRVTAEREVPTRFDRGETAFAAGEQVRKRRTTLAENVVTWGDFFDGRPVEFAAFIPPGRYSVNHPWATQYWRMDRFEKAILRQIISPATAEPRDELELVFTSSKTGETCRFVVSGFDVRALPRLAPADYPKGLYMPMGIGVPPFFQNYEDVKKQPPDRSAYASVLLDPADRWIDHHRLGIDGPVMHRDEKDARLLHVYLLSYERHSLMAHFQVKIADE
jgi:hypothetical protein